MTEIWKPIIGHDGYEVSNLGRVRSFWSRGLRWGARRKPVPHFKATYSNQRGYIICKFNGKREFMHRLIALAFIPNPNGHDQINHIDGVKSNNSLSNLEWCDTRKNTKHAWDSGLIDRTKIQGERNGNYKKHLHI